MELGVLAQRLEVLVGQVVFAVAEATEGRRSERDQGGLDPPREGEGAGVVVVGEGISGIESERAFDAR